MYYYVVVVVNSMLCDAAIMLQFNKMNSESVSSAIKHCLFLKVASQREGPGPFSHTDF